MQHLISDIREEDVEPDLSAMGSQTSKSLQNMGAFFLTSSTFNPPEFPPTHRWLPSPASVRAGPPYLF